MDSKKSPTDDSVHRQTESEMASLFDELQKRELEFLSYNAAKSHFYRNKGIEIAQQEMKRAKLKERPHYAQEIGHIKYYKRIRTISEATLKKMQRKSKKNLALKNSPSPIPKQPQKEELPRVESPQINSRQLIRDKFKMINAKVDKMPVPHCRIPSGRSKSPNLGYDYKFLHHQHAQSFRMGDQTPSYLEQTPRNIEDFDSDYFQTPRELQLNEQSKRYQNILDEVQKQYPPFIPSIKDEIQKINENQIPEDQLWNASSRMIKEQVSRVPQLETFHLTRDQILKNRRFISAPKSRPGTSTYSQNPTPRATTAKSGGRKFIPTKQMFPSSTPVSPGRKGRDITTPNITFYNGRMTFAKFSKGVGFPQGLRRQLFEIAHSPGPGAYEILQPVLKQESAIKFPRSKRKDLFETAMLANENTRRNKNNSP